MNKPINYRHEMLGYNFKKASEVVQAKVDEVISRQGDGAVSAADYFPIIRLMTSVMEECPFIGRDVMLHGDRLLVFTEPDPGESNNAVVHKGPISVNLSGIVVCSFPDILADSGQYLHRVAAWGVGQVVQNEEYFDASIYAPLADSVVVPSIADLN